MKIKTNLKKRALATFLDYAIVFVITFIYADLFGHDNEDGGKTVTGLLVLPLPIFWFLYFVVIEAFYGATLAHQGLNLKVLSINRQEIEFNQALKRHLLDIIDFFFYGIPAFIAIRNSKNHQRLGDMWANTIVVDTSDPEQYTQRKKWRKTQLGQDDSQGIA